MGNAVCTTASRSVVFSRAFFSCCRSGLALTDCCAAVSSGQALTYKTRNLAAQPRCRTAWLILLSSILSWTANFPAQAFAQDAGQPAEIRLIVRGDDMGAAHAVNEACIRCYTKGIVRSVEVIVPSPWFLEAAAMLKQHPKLDVGIHLDLTSEWELVKWGPVSKQVPTLVDENGHFYPTTRQKKDQPPNTGFLESGFRIDQVERELRAQIELGIKHLPNVTHLSAHMGTAVSTPELRTLVQQLAEQYQLPLELNGAKRVRGWGGNRTSAQEKESRLIETLENLKTGLWLFIEHPGLDSPEMRAIGHKGYENVAADRSGVTHAFTSEKVKEVIKRRDIKLISYADVLRSAK